MKYIYVVSMITENKLRVLQRIAGVLARNRLNIMNMSVYEMNNTEVSYCNVTFQSEVKTTDRVILQLQRIVELLEVKINSQVPLAQN